MRSIYKKTKYFAAALGVVSAISLSSITFLPQEALAQNNYSSPTCLNNTSDEAECKDCCDCLDADATTRKSCRDACATTDFSQNADFITVNVPSTLGADGDYSKALDTGNEQTCKEYCDGSSELVCGDRRFCRDACNAVFGDADSQAQPDNDDGDSPSDPLGGNGMNIDQTLSDQAQMMTIAFDALAFLTGDLCSDSFLPPGKVADFSGFQYLRDNDPTGMGHNTDFVTIIAFNMLDILSHDQIAELVALADSQVALINEHGYKRFPLMKAFRRLLDEDLPDGADSLSKEAVMSYSAELYRLDGQISYERARTLGNILRNLSTAQQSALNALTVLNGIGNWEKDKDDPLRELYPDLSHDEHVAVMTYASEMYSWYAGSVEADTYFCPERQGTYFGSFYMKDMPAMGNENFTIPDNLTADMGDDSLAVMTDSQAALVTNLVGIQRDLLEAIVDTRDDISTMLRQFMVQETVDEKAVLALTEKYGKLDGEIVYNYATNFSAVESTLTDDQKNQLMAIRQDWNTISCNGAYLYSENITMPEIIDTDFLFGVGDAPVDSTEGTSNLIVEGAEPILLADGFFFAEGPAADMYGNVYFSDIFENSIYTWSSDSGVTLYRDNSGGSNGLFVDHHGNLLAAEGGNKRVVVIDESGNSATLADSYNNQQLNEPNDFWGTADGGIYFTDPVYNGSQSQDGEHVYYFSRKDNTLIRVIDDMIRPNGIVGSADGSTLYVTDHGAKQTYQYTINSDGTLSGKTLFASVGGDGMTLDSNGNLYIAEDNVLVYDPSGNLLETIQLSEQPTNLCFGGTDGTLFISTRSALYSLEMNVSDGSNSGIVDDDTVDMPAPVSKRKMAPPAPLRRNNCRMNLLYKKYK